MLRSKKISIIAFLAIFVSVISLVSSGIALSATLNNGVSSVISKNDTNLAPAIYAVHLENKEYTSTNKENAFLHKEIEIKENSLFFGVTFLKAGGEITIPFTIVNEGNLDGIIKNITILGVSEHIFKKLEGIEIGDVIPKNSKKEVTFSMLYGKEESLEPEIYDSIQIILDIQK